MKKTIFLFSSLVCMLIAGAQRVDLDKFSFTVSYRNFPADPLPEEFKTYNVRIEASPSLGLGYSAEKMSEEIVIEGMKKTEETGHITVLLMYDDIIFEKSEMKERIQTTKDRLGAEVKKSFFSTEMVYSFSARATVYDYKGNTIVSNRVLYNRDQKQNYKTPEFASANEASGHYVNKSHEIRGSLSKQLTGSVLQQLNAWLNSQYGYPVQRINDILWILNNKRHPAYQDQQKAWYDFKNAIVLMSADEPVDEVKEKIQPVIDFYEKVKKQYATSDKEHRKIRYSCYYNLAKIYLYLDEPAKAMKEADALSMNGYDEKDGKYLRSMAEALESTLKRNNNYTRHFAVNIEHYESPVK